MTDNPNALRAVIADAIRATIFDPVPEWAFGDSLAARTYRQNCPHFHSMTCGNDRMDAAHTKYQEEHGGDFGQLVAVEDGWVCPVPGCGYEQKFQNHGPTKAKP